MKEFPPFRLDTGNQCLWRRGDSGDDERIMLTPTAFTVLECLVDHAGRLVTQDELLQAVWRETGDLLNRNPIAVADPALQLRNAFLQNGSKSV